MRWYAARADVYARAMLGSMIPSYLVPTVRSALTAGGIPSNAITDAGDVDAAVLISGFVKGAEVRTQFSPPVYIATKDLFAKPGAAQQPSPLLKRLKPTIVLDTNSGKSVIAPYGVADRSGKMRLGTVLGGAALALFLGGYFIGSR